jgi:hypothetical protein
MADNEKHPNDTPELRDALRSIDAIREDEFGAKDAAPPEEPTTAQPAAGDDGEDDDNSATTGGARP